MDWKSRKNGKVFLCIYFAAVLYLCLGSFHGPEGLWTDVCGIPIDKVFHFLMFLPFPILASWAFCDGGHFPRNLFRIFLTGVVFGICIELMQGLLTEGRSAEWGDFLGDTLGILFSCGLLTLHHKLSKR